MSALRVSVGSQPAPPTLGQGASQEILSKPENTIQGQMVKRKLELSNNRPSHIIAVAGVPFNRSGQDRDEWRAETNGNGWNLLVLGASLALNIVWGGPYNTRRGGNHAEGKEFLSSIRHHQLQQRRAHSEDRR